MESVKSILMERDAMTSKDADLLIKEFKEELSKRILSIDDAFELIEHYFGLEGDYLEEFI